MFSILRPLLETTEQNDIFDEHFKIALVALKMNGTHPFLKRTNLWKVRLVLVVSLFVGLTGIVFYNIALNLLNKDIMEASRHGTIAVMSIVITSKFMALMIFRREYQELMRLTEADFAEASAGRLTAEEQAVMRRYTARGVWVTKLWLYTGAITSALFPCKAFIQMAYFTIQNEFRLVMIFDSDFFGPFKQLKWDPVFFSVIFVLSFVYALYCATMYIGFDALGPVCMLHACAQLDIASLQVGALYPPTPPTPPTSRAPTDDVPSKQATIILRLQRVYRYVALLQRCKTFVYEVTIKMTTIIIPITVFQVIELLKVRQVSLEFISFFCGCIINVFVPCYYSDLLLEKSESVSAALYECGWEARWETRRQGGRGRGRGPGRGPAAGGTPAAAALAARRTLCLMILRCSRPVVIRSIFTIVCLDTFAEMCRQSYALFNLLCARYQ